MKSAVRKVEDQVQRVAYRVREPAPTIFYSLAKDQLDRYSFVLAVAAVEEAALAVEYCRRCLVVAPDLVHRANCQLAEAAMNQMKNHLDLAARIAQICSLLVADWM